MKKSSLYLLICTVIFSAILGKQIEDNSKAQEYDYFFFLPIVVKPECNSYTALMTMVPATTTVRAGEIFTATTTLSNEGCIDLGRPIYQIQLQTLQQPLPRTIASETHYLSVLPESSDQAHWTVSITDTGQVILTSVASFEVHYAFGPPVWGRSESQPTTIIVLP